MRDLPTLRLPTHRRVGVAFRAAAAAAAFAAASTLAPQPQPQVGALPSLQAVSSAEAANAGGAEFPDTVTLGGETLDLVGVGLRSKWMVKVYGMAVYQKTPTKKAAHLIGADEPKFIWIKMLRGIDGDKMRDAIDEGLEANVAEATRTAIAAQVASLKKAFPGEIPKGANIGFWYQPGRGTVLQLGDVDKARLPGKAFMSALWSIWFGKEPADADLKRSVLK